MKKEVGDEENRKKEIRRKNKETQRSLTYFSLIHLCDYLLLPHHVIFYLIEMYVPQHLRCRWHSTEGLVEILNRTSFAILGQEFAYIFLKNTS